MAIPKNENETIEFFRSAGIEPIVIDPNNEQSVKDGLNTVTERITENRETTTAHDKPSQNNGNNH